MVSIMVSKTIDQSSSLCLPAKKIIWREQPVRNRDCLLSRSFTLGGLWSESSLSAKAVTVFCRNRVQKIIELV